MAWTWKMAGGRLGVQVGEAASDYDVAAASVSTEQLSVRTSSRGLGRRRRGQAGITQQ